MDNTNLVGKKFGRLMVIDYDGKDGRHRMVKCKCDCGNYTRVRVTHLISGETKSCGCYNRDKSFKHGKRNTKLFNRWALMRRRCNNPNDRYYKDYGGRGIKVCDEWQNSFISFYEWAQSNGYNDSLTLDRIDNNGNYEPTNCRWVSMKEQSNNRRSSRWLQYQNKTMTIAQWAEYTGIKPATIWMRLHKQWSVEEALGFKRHPNARR